MSSLFPGCHRWVVWVTAVIHQWQFINQKCQQRLLLQHAVTMETRGGDGWIYLGFALCDRSLEAHANQCQSMPVWIGRTIYHKRWTAVQKWPHVPYGTSGRIWELSTSNVVFKNQSCCKVLSRYFMYIYINRSLYSWVVSSVKCPPNAVSA